MKAYLQLDGTLLVVATYQTADEFADMSAEEAIEAYLPGLILTPIPDTTFFAYAFQDHLWMMPDNATELLRDNRQFVMDSA